MLGGGTPAAAAPTCNTTSDEVTGATSGSFPIGQYGVTVWMSDKFTAADTGTVCSVKYRLLYTGTPGSATLSACLYTDNAGLPGTLIGTCSAAITESVQFTVGTEQDVTFVNMSAAKTASTVYHWVVHRSAANSTNYPSWAQISGYYANNTNTSVDGTSWSLGGINNQAKFTAYK